MNIQASPGADPGISRVGGLQDSSGERLSAAHRAEAAARRLYDAEGALHAAHQSGVDFWISAAADRLHEAVVEHVAALNALHAA